MRKLGAALIAIAASLTLGAGIASADVTTSNDAKGDSTSYAGTSNDAADHMSNSGPGIVTADSPATTWQVVKRIPRVDEEGSPVIGSNGLQIIDLVWGDVPISRGPAPATITHN